MPRSAPTFADVLHNFNPPFFLSTVSQQPPNQPPRFPDFRPDTPGMGDSDSSDCAIAGHRRRRQRSTTLLAPHQNVIDLTKDSPLHDRNANRTLSFPAVFAPERPVKRRRVQQDEPVTAGPSSLRPPPPALQVDLTAEDVDDDGGGAEELDLTQVETEEELRQKREEQRQRHESHQKVQNQQNHLVQESIQGQASRSQGPLRLGELQCVICMENITNMTATHCGHMFCHTCIMEALIAGERQSDDPSKVVSKCPVCRMKVLRHPKTGPPHVIPLELKFMAKSKIAKGKQEA